MSEHKYNRSQTRPESPHSPALVRYHLSPPLAQRCRALSREKRLERLHLHSGDRRQALRAAALLEPLLSDTAHKGLDLMLSHFLEASCLANLLALLESDWRSKRYLSVERTPDVLCTKDTCRGPVRNCARTLMCSGRGSQSITD